MIEASLNHALSRLITRDSEEIMFLLITIFLLATIKVPDVEHYDARSKNNLI